MERTVENITVFLEAAGLEELAALGIINGEKRILTGASAAPLAALMARKGVSRLESGDYWSFDLEGRFTNHYGGHYAPALRSSVSSMGEVFRGANRHINPFYAVKPGWNKDVNSIMPGPSDILDAPDLQHASATPARAKRATDLEGAGEMNGMINSLPLNRKERYWTSCVFPNIVCGDRFRRLATFLKLAGVPDKFIKSEYSNSEICFYTEYSLKESALDWREVWQIRRDTPDIVILLRANDGEKFLVVVEAKMYDFVNPSDLAGQMRRQTPVIKTIMERNAMPPENYAHLGLVLARAGSFEARFLDGFNGPCGEGCDPARVRLIGWKDVIGAYRELDGDYFYEMLKVACANPQLTATAEAYSRRKPAGGRR